MLVAGNERNLLDVVVQLEVTWAGRTMASNLGGRGIFGDLTLVGDGFLDGFSMTRHGGNIGKRLGMQGYRWQWLW